MTDQDTDDQHFDQAPNEPRRDRWGRYLLPDPATGVERAWTRVTTVSGILSDRYNLELWAQRMVALGLARREDLLALVKTNARKSKTPNGKRTLNRVVKDAIEAGNTEQRANLGTALHAATEMMDRGEQWDVPAPYDRDIEKYGAEMDKREILPLLDESGAQWIERIVVNTALGVAGTLDRVNTAPDWELPRVCDIKTGGTVHFSELDHSVQQAMYANASHYWDPKTERLEKMPTVDKKAAVIIHVPAGEARCELHELDIVRGLKAAQLAIEVREWRSAKGLSRAL